MRDLFFLYVASLLTARCASRGKWKTWSCLIASFAARTPTVPIISLRLIGLIDQAVSGIGSDEDVNLAGTRDKTKNAPGIEAPTDETATTKCLVSVCMHTFAIENWSRF
jgi:hypothetical protein